jgi:hypothetical protein
LGTWPRKVKASSFADPKDIADYRACIAQGKSHAQCLQVGDPGIGFMDNDLTGPTPFCALPPEDWKGRWGTKAKAIGKGVIVKANGRTVLCRLADTMKKRADIRNECFLDLSPAAVAAIGMSPPIKVAATWEWEDGP